jgi:hypothetical protein
MPSMTYEEETHRKEVDEKAPRSEPLRLPPATHEKDETIQIPPSDSDIESNKIIQSSEWESDPENPRNWATWKKVFHTAIPALYGFVV